MLILIPMMHAAKVPASSLGLKFKHLHSWNFPRHGRATEPLARLAAISDGLNGGYTLALYLTTWKRDPKQFQLPREHPWPRNLQMSGFLAFSVHYVASETGLSCPLKKMAGLNFKSLRQPRRQVWKRFSISDMTAELF